MFSPLNTSRDSGWPERGIKADIETIGGSGAIGVPIVVRICVSISVCCLIIVVRVFV